jgi:hypothetical protein
MSGLLLVVTSSIIHLNLLPAPLTWSPQKILWNSTISTKGACFAGADIKNMYLETPLDRYEYMKMPLSLFLQDIIEHYGLRNKALNGT